MKKKAIEICNEGYSLGLKGDLERALESFSEALKLDPTLAVAWCNKGVILAKAGNIEEALGCFEKAVKLKPASFSMWMGWAEVLIMAGRFDVALEKSERATKLSFREPKPWITRGNALFKLGRNQEALDCYQKALSIDGGNAQALKNKRSALVALKRYEEAIECHERLIAIDPHFVENWIGEGLLLEELDREADALACYERALKENPRSAILWISVGRLKEKYGDITKAVEAYDEALKIDPTLIEARRHLTALSGRGRQEELLQSLKEDPENTEIYTELGYHYFSRGLYDKAQEILSQALSRKICDPAVLNLMAWVLYEQGDLDGARTMFDQTLMHEKSFATAHFGRGLIAFRLNRLPEAEADFRRVLELNPHLNTAIYNLGLVLSIMGRFLEALAQLEHLLSIEEKNTFAVLTMGSIYLKQGRGKEAELLFRDLQKEADYASIAEEGLISALIVQNNDEEAEKMLLESQKRENPSIFPIFALGDLYHHSNRKDRAHEIWKKLDNATALTVDELICLMLALYGRGETSRAEALCEEGASRFPDNLFLLYLKALKKVRLGLPDEALRLLTDYVEKHSWMPEAYCSLARLHWRLGNRQFAYENFKRSLVPEADATPLSLLAQGFVHLHNQEFTEARAFAMRALARKSGLTDGHFLLGLIAEEQGFYGEAQEHFQRALDYVSEAEEYREALGRVLALIKVNGARRGRPGTEPGVL
jgi:tetratricopeptide (TPR) repeat protein